MSKPRLWVSVSGGRSSCFMAWKIKTEYSSQYDVRFGFANTGEENEETLIFMHRCDRAWDLGVVWLEASVYHGARRSTGHKVVDFVTAARNGEPYEEVIRKYGIPNKTFPHCTRELKLNPMKSYLASIGWARGTFVSAVGIRADEPKRLRRDADAAGIVYPLAHWFPTTKPEVNDWWASQPFDLQLEDYRGNCKWCWKKSTAKLVRIAQETPEVFNFPARMEELHGKAGFNKKLRSLLSAGRVGRGRNGDVMAVYLMLADVLLVMASLISLWRLISAPLDVGHRTEARYAFLPIICFVLTVVVAGVWSALS